MFRFHYRRHIYIHTWPRLASHYLRIYLQLRSTISRRYSVLSASLSVHSWPFAWWDISNYVIVPFARRDYISAPRRASRQRATLPSFPVSSNGNLETSTAYFQVFRFLCIVCCGACKLFSSLGRLDSRAHSLITSFRIWRPGGEEITPEKLSRVVFPGKRLKCTDSRCI